MSTNNVLWVLLILGIYFLSIGPLSSILHLKEDCSTIFELLWVRKKILLWGLFRLKTSDDLLWLRKQFHSFNVDAFKTPNVCDLSPSTADNPGCNAAVWPSAKSQEDLVRIPNNHNEGKLEINRLSSSIWQWSFGISAWRPKTWAGFSNQWWLNAAPNKHCECCTRSFLLRHMRKGCSMSNVKRKNDYSKSYFRNTLH